MLHGVITAALLSYTAYLLCQPPAKSAPCPTPSPSTCPNHCSLHGACINNRCTCDSGWVGEDCGARECPNNCTSQGACIKGFCVCKSQYGGDDCSLDRLELSRGELLQDLDFDVKLGEQCHFLSLEEVEQGGGNIHYAGEKHKSYHVNSEYRAFLPQECPRMKWKSCAIVGNSGTLRYGNFGTEIDEHDMIYRFNQAPTGPYSKYVGSRTTFESLNAKFAHALQNEDPDWMWRDPMASYIFFEPLKLKDTYIDIRKRHPGVQAYMFSPAFAYQAHRIYDRLQEKLQAAGFGCFSGEKPMSGFYAILYILDVCNSVDLYGFDAWTDDMSGKFKLMYHYFDEDEPRPGAHSFDLTFYMYRLLEMSDDYPVRLRLVDVPGDADFGSRPGQHSQARVAVREEEEDLTRDIE